MNLTPEDVQEVWHKMQVLADSPDLQSDYGITELGVKAIIDSIPKQGGKWTPPSWAHNVIKGEMQDHIVVMRDCAKDAADAGNPKQASEIRSHARRLAAMFKSKSIN